MQYSWETTAITTKLKLSRLLAFSDKIKTYKRLAKKTTTNKRTPILWENIHEAQALMDFK